MYTKSQSLSIGEKAALPFIKRSRFNEVRNPTASTIGIGIERRRRLTAQENSDSVLHAQENLVRY